MKESGESTIEAVPMYDKSFDAFMTELLEQKKNDPSLNTIKKICKDLRTILVALWCESKAITLDQYTKMITLDGKQTSLQWFLSSREYDKDYHYDILDYFSYNNNDRILIDLLEKYKNSIQAWQDFIELLFKSNIEAFLDKCNTTKNSGLQNFITKNIADDDDMLPILMEHFSLIKTLPFAKDFLLENCFMDRDAPTLSFPIVDHIDEWKDQSYAGDVLNTMIWDKASYPWLWASAILQHASLFISEPYASEIISKASEINPYACVYYFGHIQDLPNSITLIQDAFGKNPISALKAVHASQRNHDLYAAIPNPELLATAGTLFKMNIINDVLTLQHNENTITIPLTKESFSSLLEDNRSIQDLFSNLPWETQKLSFYKDLLLIIAKEDPMLCIENYKKIKDLPYISDILQIIAEKDPTICLDNYDTFEKLAMRKTIIARYLTNNPFLVKEILLGKNIERKYAILENLSWSRTKRLESVASNESPIRVELMHRHPAAISLLLYLSDKHNNKTLTIWKQQIPISLEHTNLISWLLYTQESLLPNFATNTCDAETTTKRTSIVETYNTTLNNALADGNETADLKQKTKVLFAHRNKDSAYANSDRLFVKYQEVYPIDKVEDCLPWDEVDLDFATFLAKVEGAMSDPNIEQVIVDIGEHGYNNGSVNFGKHTWTQDNFNTLFQLQKSAWCRLLINISSCHSTYKLDQLVDSSKFLVMWSSKDVELANSDAVFLQAYEKKASWSFARWDFDEDGQVTWIEAQTYKMIYYNDTLMTIFWQDKATRRRIASQHPDQSVVADHGG